ncbi:putative head protein [Roseobacter phage CRP-901]|nr:putative head protein [Roseobacter phage CRP-901]
MAMNRANFAKMLEPGLNTLFGLEYDSYPAEYEAVFESNTSQKAFEEDVLLAGFGNAPTKSEGSAVSYDAASQQWTARYQHETIALAFSITEEAEEDGQYGSIASRYTKALARSMASTKEIKAANILNTATTVNGGDGAPLLSASHPTQNGNQSNILATAADLSEVSLEAILIQIADMKDDRGLRVAAQGTQLVIPTAYTFVAERLLESQLRVGTADNDINAIRNGGYLPKGYHIMRRLTDSDQWFVQTDIPDGLKMFQRSPMKKGMEGDFETGNVRYKVRERYSFGATDWRGVFGSQGAA